MKEEKTCAREGCDNILPKGRRKWCSDWCAYIGPQLEKPPGEDAMRQYRSQNVRNSRARRSWAKKRRIY